MTGGRPPYFSRLISGGNRSPELARLRRASRGECGVPPGGGTQISRRKDPANGGRDSESKKRFHNPLTVTVTIVNYCYGAYISQIHRNFNLLPISFYNVGLQILISS